MTLEGQSINGYLFSDELGRGSFGEVYKASKDGNDYAIKVIRIGCKEGKKTGEIEESFVDQTGTQCPFLVKYVLAFKNPKGNILFVVMEFCAEGDLEKLVKKLNPLKGIVLAEKRVMKILIQLLLGLEYLHRHKILHRDIKAQNVFVNAQDDIKIGDFGCGKILDESDDMATTFVGTLYYLAPEVFNEKPYSFAADIWSLGVLFYYVCTSQLPFKGSRFTLPDVVKSGTYSPLPEFLYPEEISDIIDSMLQKNPLDRPSVSDLLSNGFILKWGTRLKLMDFFPSSTSPSASSPLFTPASSSASSISTHFSVSALTPPPASALATAPASTSVPTSASSSDSDTLSSSSIWHGATHTLQVSDESLPLQFMANSFADTSVTCVGPRVVWGRKDVHATFVVDHEIVGGTYKLEVEADGSAWNMRGFYFGLISKRRLQTADLSRRVYRSWGTCFFNNRIVLCGGREILSFSETNRGMVLPNIRRQTIGLEIDTNSQYSEPSLFVFTNGMQIPYAVVGVPTSIFFAVHGYYSSVWLELKSFRKLSSPTINPALKCMAIHWE